LSSDRNNGLSDSERKALRGLAEGPSPGGGLEDRTVMALRNKGFIRSNRGGILMKLSMTVGAAVAATLVFVAGVTVGKKAGDPLDIPVATGGEKQYMLLLYTSHSGDDPSGREDMTTEPGATENDEFMMAIVEEYRDWGRRMTEAGRLVAAEKLKDDAFVIAPGGENVQAGLTSGRVLGGYFLIKAKDLDQARTLSMTHPHLRYGGEIEIRPLDLHN